MPDFRDSHTPREVCVQLSNHPGREEGRRKNAIDCEIACDCVKLANLVAGPRKENFARIHTGQVDSCWAHYESWHSPIISGAVSEHIIVNWCPIALNYFVVYHSCRDCCSLFVYWSTFPVWLSKFWFLDYIAQTIFVMQLWYLERNPIFQTTANLASGW